MQGREGWLREAKRQLDQDRWDGAGPTPRSRSERLREAGRRLKDDLGAERRGNQAYEHYRATARDKQGRRLSRAPNPYQPPQTPDGKVNLTDPDSRLMKGTRSYIQGYNAQAAVNEQPIVLAAEITVEGVDFSQLEPMVAATVAELDKAGVIDKPDVAVADAGYWNEQHLDAVTAEHGVQVLIPPTPASATGRDPGGPVVVTRLCDTSSRRIWEIRLYAKRKQTVEPMFGHTKHNRRFDRFHRRGRTAVRTEWRLMMMTHNLTKLHSHQIATATA